MAGPTYNPNAYLPTRVWNYFRFGTQRDIGEHNANLLERTGNAGLWPWENLPGKIMNACRDPRVVTVALTSITLLADSFGFYPANTSFYVKAAWALLPTIPFWAAKFATYLGSVEFISSLGFGRALGRFTNPQLMNQYHAVHAD